jgi:hypothetical protein
VKYYHYVVHGILPADPPKTRYARNMRLGIVCDSVLRAAQIAKTNYPQFEINGVTHAGEIHYLDGIAELVNIPVTGERFD